MSGENCNSFERAEFSCFSLPWHLMLKLDYDSEISVLPNVARMIDHEEGKELISVKNEQISAEY